MKILDEIQIAIEQTLEMLLSIKDAIHFIRTENLLEGFLDHKWIMAFTAGLAGLFSILIFSGDVFNKANEEVATITTSDMSEALNKLKEVGEMAVFSGGTKYIFIIFLEVIIFYFASKTLSILQNTDNLPALKDFINAEKRMIRVMISNFFKAIIFQIIAVIPLSILGLSYLKPVVVFSIHAYFIGYAFMDNYNEQFEKSIKESSKIIWKHKYASFTIGSLISLLLHVPILGLIATPFIGSVSSTLYAFENQINEDGPASDTDIS